MENKDLKALLKILRANGVLYFKTVNLEMKILPDSPSNPTSDESEPEMTDEQLMFYSSPDQ